MSEEIPEVITTKTNYIELFKKHFTIILISIIVGMTIGVFFCKTFYNWRMDEATKLGGFIHKNNIYDIKARPWLHTIRIN